MHFLDKSFTFFLISIWIISNKNLQKSKVMLQKSFDVVRILKTKGTLSSYVICGDFKLYKKLYSTKKFTQISTTATTTVINRNLKDSQNSTRIYENLYFRRDFSGDQSKVNKSNFLT